MRFGRAVMKAAEPPVQRYRLVTVVDSEESMVQVMGGLVQVGPMNQAVHKGEMEEAQEGDGKHEKDATDRVHAPGSE